MHNQTHLSLATVLLSVGLGACTNTSDCFVDTDCGKGKICERDRCITGSRDRPDDGDPVLDDDGVPLVGDPGLVPADGTGAPSNLVGPTITNLTPYEYQIVSGVIVIRAEVFDVDGLSETEPVLAIVGDHIVVELRSGAFGNEFTGLFNTAELGIMQYPRLVVTAADFYGNRSSVGHEFALDSYGPVVAFRSPDVQYYRFAGTNEVECSVAAPPLGSTAVAHGQSFRGVPGNPFVGFGFFPRLRVEDRGNGLSGFYAGVDDDNVYLYLLDQTGIATGQKLVVGTGGQCTGVNPALLPDPANPQPSQAIVQSMVPVEKWGEPNFTENAADQLRGPCTWNGNSCLPTNLCCDTLPCYAAPDPVCPPDPLTVWLTDAGGSPLIYVLNDYDVHSPVLCAGGAFDTRNFTADGPVCLAAVAYDDVGNVGVSQPIAICVDRDNSGDCDTFSAAVDAAALCSDGCAAPDFGTAVELINWR